MEAYGITDSGALAELCERARDADWVAVDTEFLRDDSYYARLCLVQLAGPGWIAWIDPFLVSDLCALDDLMLDRAVTKVLHSGRQDLEIFFERIGAVPGPVFDTQIAASLLGHGDQIGYAAVVEAVLGERVDKGMTRADWAQRPLPAAALSYALDDVRHLGVLFDRFSAELAARDRLAWAREEFARVEDAGSYRVEPAEAWRRVKGGQRLPARARAILCELAAWREATAMRLDRPRRWVVSDALLVEIARRAPRSAAELGEHRGRDGRALAEHTPELLDAVARGRKRTPPPQEPDPRASSGAVVDELMAVIRVRAEAAGVPPAIVASRRDLERLVAGDRELRLLTGVRGELVGRELLAIVEGRARGGRTPAARARRRSPRTR